MIVMIDNYDSFTYNLVQYIRDIGHDVQVFANNEVTVDELKRLKPDAICLSPGPGTPNDAGISLSCVDQLKGHIPILGVCLGHQSIVQAFGGRIIKAEKPMHGKRAFIHHDGKTIFNGLPQNFIVTRYHSLIADEARLPKELEVSARAVTGEIMAVRHREWPIEGVQFHPEAILTEHGKILLQQCFKHFAK